MQCIYTSRPRKTAFTSQYVGVNWDKKYLAWKASISEDGRKNILGYYATERDAALAYNNAAARLGRPVNLIEENRK